jgi:hypothetical protein
MAAMAVMRGMFVSGVAMLYVLFVVGALLGKSWAKWFCLTAVIINLLLVLSGLVQGASLLNVIAWSVIPVTLLFYLFSNTGRAALKGT